MSERILTNGNAMGSGSELSAELSMLLKLLLLLLLLLPLLLLMALSLLMALLLLMVLLLLLVLLMLLVLLVLFEIEVASFSARTGWRGTRMAKRAKERRRSILRVCSVVQVFSLKPLISSLTQDWPGVTQSDGGRGE